MPTEDYLEAAVTDNDVPNKRTATDRAIAEARDQGLPDRIEDPLVLANVATMLIAHTRRG